MPLKMKTILHLFIYMYVWVLYVCPCTTRLPHASRDQRRAQDHEALELQTGAGIWTWILCKNSQCSNHWVISSALGAVLTQRSFCASRAQHLAGERRHHRLLFIRAGGTLQLFYSCSLGCSCVTGEKQRLCRQRTTDLNSHTTSLVQGMHHRQTYDHKFIWQAYRANNSCKFHLVN